MTMNSVFSHLKHSVIHFINIYLYMWVCKEELRSLCLMGKTKNRRFQGSPSALLSASEKENYPIHFFHEPCNYLKGGNKKASFPI